MNTKTGEIGPLAELLKTAKPGQIIKPIDPANLSPRVRALLEATGKAQITRNSRCPCGSGKRFKRCCMTK